MVQMKKIITYLTFIAGCVILTAGCDRNEEIGSHNGPIRINVNTVGATKSVAMTSTSLQGQGFVLDVIADDEWTKVDDDGNPTGPMHSAGAYVTSGGAANVQYSSTSHPDTPGYDHDTDETEGWYIHDSEGYEVYNWINGIKLRFWARYPENSMVDGDTNEGTLTLTVPGAGVGTESFTYTLPTSVTGSDATNQKDIMFAYSERIKQKEDTNDDIDITFNHPLSEIRFCVSPDDGTFDISLQIKRIEIKNVVTSGSCVFNPAGTITGTTKMFTWTPSTSTLASYSQDYNTYFDVYEPTGWDGSTYDAVNGYHVYTCQNAFMLIPHTLSYATGKETVVEVTFYDPVTSSDIIRTHKICGDSSNPVVWKPGYYYTYKIIATKIGRSISSYIILTDWTDHDSKISVPC